MRVSLAAKKPRITAANVNIVASIHGDGLKPSYENQARAGALARSTNPAVNNYGGSWGRKGCIVNESKTRRGRRSMCERDERDVCVCAIAMDE